MRIEVVQMTPEMAKQMLKLNTGNFRPVDSRRVKMYANEMESGQWKVNGETIKISNNVLVDGQHRLNAVVRSCKIITMIVVYDIEGDGEGIDRGKQRSVSQILAHRKIANSSIVAAMARLCVAHGKEVWSDPVRPDVVIDSEVIHFVETNIVNIQECIPYARKLRDSLPQGLVAAVVYLGTKWGTQPSESARWFCERLLDGVGLGDYEPVLHLRNVLAKVRRGSSLTAPMARAYLTKAWNLTANGKQCSVHQFRVVMSGMRAMELPNRVEILE
jgi:hypothetical protein